MDDSLRQSVIESIMSGSQESPPTPTPVVESTQPIKEVVDSPKKSNGRKKYDLTNALGSVLETKVEQGDRPKAVSSERKKCNETIDKTLLRDLMMGFKR
jgi:hypothetical protein